MPPLPSPSLLPYLIDKIFHMLTEVAIAAFENALISLRVPQEVIVNFVVANNGLECKSTILRI